MKKSIHGVLGLVVLLGTLFAIGVTQEASAQVQVNVNIVAPTPLQFAAPPDVYVIPSGISYVYMVPNYDGLYFYNGYWYRFYNGYWFRSFIYNGYWDYMELPMVPQCIIAIPPEYIYYVPSGYYHIHYHDLHRNWRTWDEDHHWNRYDWYKHEMRDDIRRERYSHIDRDRQQRGIQAPRHQQGHERQRHDVQQPSAPRPVAPPRRVEQQPSPTRPVAPPLRIDQQPSAPRPAPPPRKVEQQPSAPRPVAPPHRVEQQPSEPRPATGQIVEHPRPQQNPSVRKDPQQGPKKYSQPQNQPAQGGGTTKKESRKHGNIHPNG